MKAVILAAGVGSRLGRPLPKCLALLPDGETILERQIRLLREAGVRDMHVVIGFKKELVMERCPHVSYIYNPFYYITNTSKSLLWALRLLHGDVLWTNGDVVFDPEVLRRVADRPGNAVAVNTLECEEEEIKYRTHEAEQDRIVALSKAVRDAEGEALGVNKITADHLEAFVGALEECGEGDYFERGIELLMERGVFFQAVDVSDARCIEVDFEEDLAAARKLFSI